MSGWVDQTKQRADLMAAQVRYGQDIQAWLERQFPDLCVPAPHPAAVTTVIRLHWMVGKGKLTVREHGPVIRAAVEHFNSRRVADGNDDG